MVEDKDKGMPSYSNEEKKWLENGGISPCRVTRQISREVLDLAGKIYPDMVKRVKEKRIEDLELCEFFAGIQALIEVYIWGDKGGKAAGEYPIRLADKVSGFFAETIQSLWDYRLALGEEPNGTPLDEVRWHGKKVVAKLVEKGFLLEDSIPSDDYTTGDAYKVTEKGIMFVKMLFSDNKKTDAWDFFIKDFKDPE